MVSPLYDRRSANGALPLVSRIEVDLRRLWLDLKALDYRATAVGSRESPNRDAILGRIAGRQGDIMAEIEARSLELDALGVVACGRSMHFPGAESGSVGWWCWRAGEERVSRWHGLDESC